MKVITVETFRKSTFNINKPVLAQRIGVRPMPHGFAFTTELAVYPSQEYYDTFVIACQGTNLLATDVYRV